ncbi:hypothetical protein FIBSPDRAFT_948199 [Athelia psychrophila]|uniref:Transmembrane protein n=1 Tax=Athelia psychrophila TaxID=1759441 RepID=A0A166R6X1_9AGAM|nr:hypothetical protein FIBSPDRAFT_903509 [Fibularhizoctonia sp. CBS 109695]KZP27969.1 hypothetical protein FIBSPDRAFT_948199 [Fibularhizoctonia sp. CBS 109695]
MFANRIIPFLFLVATFSLFAFAAPTSPVLESSLVARSDAGTCATSGCNEQAILTILTTLQAKIEVSIKALDGVTAPGPHTADICAAINAAVALLVKLDVNVSIAGSLVGNIVSILVAIILSIATCISKYGLVIAVTISLQFDLALSGLVKCLIKLIPGLIALLGSALKVDLTLLQSVKLVLTLVGCNLPCGC